MQIPDFDSISMSELNKLRWRCRRGTLELDEMLIRYLERHYFDADSDERRAFLKLLEMEDSELIHFLMGEQVPDNAEIFNIVTKIRQLSGEI